LGVVVPVWWVGGILFQNDMLLTALVLTAPSILKRMCVNPQ
jgi:hypothetical protein